MKKTHILTAIITLLAINTYGQGMDVNSPTRIHLGVKAGLNYSNIYDSKGDNFDAEGKFGAAAGLFLAIPIGRFLGIQPEILYSQKGYKQTGAFLGSNYDLTRTSHYIDIPLLVSIKPASFITVQVGPQFSYLLKQKDVFKSALGTVAQQEEFTNDNIRKNTLCAVGGIDFNFKRIIIGTRAGWDLQNNNGDGSSTNPRYKNAWVQATLGFRIL